MQNSKVRNCWPIADSAPHVACPMTRSTCHLAWVPSVEIAPTSSCVAKPPQTDQSATQPIFAESKRQAALFRLFAGIANQRWSYLSSESILRESQGAANLFTYAHGTQFFVTPVTNAT